MTYGIILTAIYFDSSINQFVWAINYLCKQHPVITVGCCMVNMIVCNDDLLLMGLTLIKHQMSEGDHLLRLEVLSV